MPKYLIEPMLKKSFDEIYKAIASQQSQRTPELLTTGNVPFRAEAKVTRDARRYIALPHNNRIYEKDWGYRTNSMGKDGQRIGQYSEPLDQWATQHSYK